MFIWKVTLNKKLWEAAFHANNWLQGTVVFAKLKTAGGH